jgi:hypothetical protein
MGTQDIRVVHRMPGRVRFKTARLKANARFGREIEEALSPIAGIRAVEANPITGSVLILYDLERLASLDSLLAFQQNFPRLFPEVDLFQLQAFLDSSGDGSSAEATGPPSEPDAARLGQGTTTAGQLPGGCGLKTLVPLGLVCLGVRGLLVAEEVVFPAWYDLLWFGFGSYMMLNRAERPAAQ